MRRYTLTVLILLGFVSLADASPGKPYTGWNATGTLSSGSGTIARDSGSSFPVSATILTDGQTIDSPTFTVSASGTLIVITVATHNFSGNIMVPVALSWIGGDPTGVSAFTLRVDGKTSGGQIGTSIFTATATSPITSKQIRATYNATATQVASAISVDVLTGANSTTFGGTVASNNSDSALVLIRGTITGVSAGSWIFAGCTTESVTPTTVAGTTEIAEAAQTYEWAAIGANTTGTSGDIEVGWSGASANWQSFAALEIKPASAPQLPGWASTGGTGASYRTFNLDSGFPKVTAQTAGNTSSTIATAAFNTTGPSLIVAVAAVGSSSQDAVPISIAGGGLTWTSQVDVPLTGTYANWAGVRIWTASSSSSLSSATVTATFSNTGGHAATLAVYSFTGGTVGNVAGATGTPNSDSARSGNIAITASAGAILLAVTLDGSSAAGLTPYTTGISVATDTSATDEVGGNTVSILNVRSTSMLTAQSYNIGATSNSVYSSVAAIEIKPQ